jgi:hypothetical protein
MNRITLLLSSVLALAGCATTGIDIERFQPPITVERAPARPLNVYSLHNNTTLVGLESVRALVPSYNGQGKLLVSWTPHRDGPRGRPTFVLIHGGHGLGPTNFANAVWLRNAFLANVLVLDSYWSRGRNEN